VKHNYHDDGVNSTVDRPVHRDRYLLPLSPSVNDVNRLFSAVPSPPRPVSAACS